MSCGLGCPHPNRFGNVSFINNGTRACAGGFFKDDVSPFTDLRRSPLYRAFPRVSAPFGPFTYPSHGWMRG